MTEILIRCPFCGSTYSILIPFEGYLAWQSGELIQNALPELTATERECLISGVCPTCQIDVFGEDDE